jgi:hypothetical protein
MRRVVGVMNDHDSRDAVPEFCVLEHKVFALSGDVRFWRAPTDGTPVMVVDMGEIEACLPLRSLQREFGIEDDSPDGRMLGMIAESLDYVTGLRLGDPLPAEVRTGEASWTPDPSNFRLVAGRLQIQLLEWVSRNDPNAIPLDARNIARLDEDPALRQHVQNAFERAARELGLPNGEAVIGVFESLVSELSYIEALRGALLRRVQLLSQKLEKLRSGNAADKNGQLSLNRVIFLTETALRQIGQRFDDIDAQTGEIIAALRNAESQQAFIRSNRDHLYRCQRAWDPILAQWDQAPFMIDSAVWKLVAQTYRFLAARWLPAQEWHSLNAMHAQRGRKKIDKAMKW